MLITIYIEIRLHFFTMAHNESTIERISAMEDKYNNLISALVEDHKKSTDKYEAIIDALVADNENYEKQVMNRVEKRIELMQDTFTTLVTKLIEDNKKIKQQLAEPQTLKS